MRVTNKSGGPRGFFGKNPSSPVILRPGESAEVEGFDPALPSHAAQIAAGEIEVGDAAPDTKAPSRKG